MVIRLEIGVDSTATHRQYRYSIMKSITLLSIHIKSYTLYYNIVQIFCLRIPKNIYLKYSYKNRLERIIIGILLTKYNFLTFRILSHSSTYYVYTIHK